MRRATIVLAGAAAVLGAGILLALGPGLAGSDRIALRAEDAEMVAAGAALYAANCASCHGADLEGQPEWRSPGPKGRLPAPPHDASGHTWHHDGDTLFRLTKYGVGELIGDPGYATDMPAYKDLLSDAEIVAVLSYIKSTWPREIRARHDAMENGQ